MGIANGGQRTVDMKERGLTGVFLTSVLLVGLLVGAEANDEPVRAPRPTHSVSELIASLSSSSFRTRRRATRELYRSGASAAVPLGQAARGKNLEVAARAIGVLERMYTDRDLDVVAASELVLEELSASGSRSLSRRARKVLESHVELRQRRAVDQILRLGGIFKDSRDKVVDPNDPDVLGQPIVTLQLGNGWTGGDAGLKYVGRLTRLRSLLVIEGASASIGALTDLNNVLPMLRIIRRGRALLGVKAFSSPCQIQEVRPGLAADRAGIKVGDMILTFDGKAIADFQGLVDLIKEHRPGDTVPLTVERRINGKKTTVALSVKLDSWEAASRVPPASIKKPVPAKPIRKK